MVALIVASTVKVSGNDDNVSNDHVALEEDCLLFYVIIISNTRDSISSGYPSNERRIENTTRS